MFDIVREVFYEMLSAPGRLPVLRLDVLGPISRVQGSTAPFCSLAAHDVTVLALIKLTKFAVALRLRCGSCKLIF